MTGPSLTVESRYWANSPDAESAVALLHEIANRPSKWAPRKVDKQLVLYGAGALGKLAKQYFDRLGIAVAFVVDAEAERGRADPFWTGVRLIAPHEASEHDKASSLLAICVGKAPYTQVVMPLAEDGWRDIVPFYTISAAYLDRHPLGNGWFTGALTYADVNGIEYVLRRYSDNASRAHHLQFIAWHRLHEEWFFDDAPVDTENRYFISEIVSALNDNEVFVDLGAHHGSVTANFIERRKKRFKEIWAIEPDTENLGMLEQRLAALPSELGQHIHVMACAVGRSEGRQSFFAGLDFASQISSRGNTHVDVRTIDSLGLEPTFIKAHLEGSEMDAILGGTETIRRHCPLIALSVYHNRLGLWNCQKALMEAFGNCGYRFLFRIHSWHGTGAVFYLVNRPTTG